ncbi:unnamed protein product [Agarophyton chilense]
MSSSDWETLSNVSPNVRYTIGGSRVSYLIEFTRYSSQLSSERHLSVFKAVLLHKNNDRVLLRPLCFYDFIIDPLWLSRAVFSLMPQGRLDSLSEWAIRSIFGTYNSIVDGVGLLKKDDFPKQGVVLWLE